MTEQADQSYKRPESVNRPLFESSPKVYKSNERLIEAANRGEIVTEAQAFEEYFETLAAEDGTYMGHIQQIVAGRASQFPEAVAALPNRKLQLVVPMYREGENIEQFLQNVKAQFEASEKKDWGITFVIDYAVPYRNPQEFNAFKLMKDKIEDFLKENPGYKPYIDYIFYGRKKDTDEPILPVGLARKVGEDVLMYEKLQEKKRSNSDNNTHPFYLGMMDIDAGNLDAGLLNEMAQMVPKTEQDMPNVIRVRGSFDKDNLRDNLQLHPLEMMWEGATSEVGTNTRHNPFPIGRLSAIPARGGR